VEIGNSYKKIVNSLKRLKKSSTAADICAETALPLTVVRELLSKAADEYSGHLRVSESGEIQYYFPNGFVSRYRGISAVLKKVAGKILDIVKKSSVLLFKIWIMIMLIGYFVIFVALALATVFLQIAARSGNNNSGSDKGGSLNFGAFDLLWRIWFFNELTRPRYGNSGYGNLKNIKTKQKRPMHKAIFSFVFGEEDPNADWEETKDKAVISYIKANNGVMSLYEYMAFTGENSFDAEKSVLAFCSKFEGSPEVTEEGVIVYRFDKLMLQGNIWKHYLSAGSSNKGGNLSPPIKRLKTFSANSKKMNGAFIAINAVNLLFGSYFLYQSFAVGKIIFDSIEPVIQGIYGFTSYFLGFVMSEPQNFIRIALGAVPLVFSLFFWLIPAIRGLLEKKANKENKLSNFKRFCFSKIFSSPENIDFNFMEPASKECLPEDPSAVADKVIKETSVISSPEIFIAANGNAIYSFNDLEREKQSIKKYRENIDIKKSYIGKTIFDSND